MLYDALPGSSWSRNQSRCWANEAGSGPVAVDPARSAGPGGPAPAGELVLDQPGEPGDGRLVEEVAQRRLDAEGVADPGEELGGQQRVAAQVEEVVVDPDPVDARATRPRSPRAPPRPAPGAARSGRRPSRRAGVGVGQGVAVDLAVGRQRQGVERDERRGTMYSGRPPERPSSAPTAPASGRVGRQGLLAGASRASRPPRGRGCPAGASISPSSTRKPRILTWWSTARGIPAAVGATGRGRRPVEPAPPAAERVGQEPLGGQARPR